MGFTRGFEDDICAWLQGAQGGLLACLHALAHSCSLGSGRAFWDERLGTPVALRS